MRTGYRALAFGFLAFCVFISTGVAKTGADAAKTPKKDVVMMGDPGCHGGGCPDASTPCKECGPDGWCWCSTCCVAMEKRAAGWKERDAQAKEKARAQAKKQGLPTDRTP